MKRLPCLLLCLLLCAAVLSACAPIQTPVVEATLVPRADTAIPDVRDADAPAVRSTVTLFFRYGSEPYLAAEARAISQLPGQSFEMALLTELVAGPGPRSAELRGLFPTGVRVLSTVRQGRTLFVTLSAEIMNLYADEPLDWQEDDTWRREAPLRRQLCMQGIICTVTENCDVDQVQILVKQSGVTDSLRLKQNYFLDDSEDDVLVGPMTRDDSLLLSADNTMDVILACWRLQDWDRLYLYLAARDPMTGTERPVYRNFVQTMERYPRLTSAARSDGSISPDGAAATYAIDFTQLSDGAASTTEKRVLRLCRENGLWKISLSQLTGWLEE